MRASFSWLVDILLFLDSLFIFLNQRMVSGAELNWERAELPSVGGAGILD